MVKGKNSSVSIYRKRITVVYFFVLLLGLACTAKILWLVFFQRGLYDGTSKACVDTTIPGWENNPIVRDSTCQCFINENTLRPVRGEIYDDKGRLLVANYSVFEVAIAGNKIGSQREDTLQKNTTLRSILIEKLSKDFYNQFKDRFPKRDLDSYRKLFSKALIERRYVTLLPVKTSDEKAWITSADTAFIKHLPYLYKTENGKRKLLYNLHWNFISTNVRINPYGEMARRTLGMCNDDRHYGLEYFMNNILAGKDGSKKYLELNHAVVPLNNRMDPIDGNNIHTTIDLEIQNIVHNELSKKLTEVNAEWGCAIVMETQTGEIKAISNLRRAAADGSYYTESMEYGLNAKVEPGSTFKLASLLSYLEKVKDDDKRTYPMFNHVFKYPLKSGNYRAYPKSDSKVHNETPGTPSEIFQRSSNIGVASMIFDAYGMKGFHNYRKQLAKLGLFDVLHTQLGDVKPANIKNGTNDFNAYYGTCFGAGFTMPVIRTLVYYNAIANNGKMMAPLFVKFVTNDYDTIETFEPEVLNQQIVSPLTVQKAHRYLKSVVWGDYGTARSFKDPTCPFAGKTGTRDIWSEEEGAYNYNRNSVSFCGYFPMDSPKYTAIVFMYNVAGHSTLAVDVFSKIARSIMNSSNYSALHSVEESPRQPLLNTTPINKCYFNAILSQMGYDTVPYNTNSQYLKAIQGGTATHVKVKAIRPSTYQGAPDVRNLIASDAIAELTRAGFKVTIHGKGVVTKEEINRGNHTAILYLETP